MVHDARFERQSRCVFARWFTGYLPPASWDDVHGWFAWLYDVQACCKHGVLRQALDSVWSDAPCCAHSSAVSTRTLWQWKKLRCAWRCGSTATNHQTTQTGDRSCCVEQSCERSLMPGSGQNSPVVTVGACGRLCCEQDLHTRKERPPRYSTCSSRLISPRLWRMRTCR